MPVTRRNLTKAEIVEHVARARQMQAFGMEMEPSKEWLRVAAEHERRNAKVEIEQVGGIHESRIFELESGRAGYIIGVAITNQTARAIYCGDIQLRTLWGDDLFEWLAPMEVPLKFRTKPDSSYQAYRFPGKLGLEFPYEGVVNHVLMEGQCLSPKRPVSGLLLATGGLMPTHLQHGQWQDVTLAIIGSDHSEYTQKITLWTERMESRPKPIKRRNTLQDGSGESGALNGAPVPSPGNALVRDSVSLARASEVKE